MWETGKNGHIHFNEKSKDQKVSYFNVKDE